MNKLFTSIAVASLSLTMAVGVGVAVNAGSKNATRVDATTVKAAEAIFNATNNKKSISDYTSTWTNTTNGFSWTLKNFNNNKTASGGDGTWAYVKCGSKKAASVGSIETKNAVSDVITKVEITIDALTSTKINSITLYGGASGTTSLGTFAKSTGTKTFNIPSASQSANQKYKVSIDCQQGSSNGLLTLSNVTLYKEVQEQDITGISVDDQSMFVGKTHQVTVTPSPEGATLPSDIAYASSDSSVFTVSSSGLITAAGSGTATLTVTSASKSLSTTATITVNAYSHPGVTVGSNYVFVATANGTGSNVHYALTSFGAAGSVTAGLATSYTNTPSTSYEVTVVNGAYEGSVAFQKGTAYIAYGDDGKNSLTTSNSINALSSFHIFEDANHTGYYLSVVKYHGETSPRYLSFNENIQNGSPDSPRFACYTNLNQKPVNFYEISSAALTDFTIASTLSLHKGQNGAIEVTYTPDNAGDKTLNWTSSNTSVATVNSDGLVTAVAVGQATISASKVINSVTVTRECAVTVLTNQTAHAGTAADPFSVDDAVNVAKDNYTLDNSGSPVSKTGAYVKGIITANISRTTSTLTFIIGDNASQTSAANGGFELFKLATIKGTALATYYSTAAEVERDFNIGYTVIASGNITLYSHTTPEFEKDGNVSFNSYIEAREYAEAFNTAMDAICKTDNTTDTAALASAWSTQSSNYSSLDPTSKSILVGSSANASGTAVEKCVAQYDWIVGRYEYTDYMGRGAASQGLAFNNLFAGLNSESTIAVIIIVALTSVTAIGAIFFIKRRKYN
jgi:uncharacterized protein YjdB